MQTDAEPECIKDDTSTNHEKKKERKKTPVS